MIFNERELRVVWLNGIAPKLSLTGLRALYDALEKDSPELVQGVTVQPGPLEYMVGGACALAYCEWKSAEHVTVAELEKKFLVLQGRIEEEHVWTDWTRDDGEDDDEDDEEALLKDALVAFVTWFDESCRVVAFAHLLPLVKEAITKRIQQC